MVDIKSCCICADEFKDSWQIESEIMPLNRLFFRFTEHIILVVFMRFMREDRKKTSLAQETPPVNCRLTTGKNMGATFNRSTPHLFKGCDQTYCTIAYTMCWIYWLLGGLGIHVLRHYLFMTEVNENLLYFLVPGARLSFLNRFGEVLYQD